MRLGTYVCVWVWESVCLFFSLSLSIYLSLWVCVFVCVCVCVCVYVCVRVCDRVMTLHGTCTSMIFQVLTVVSCSMLPTHLLQEFGWEMFTHPLYSSDLAPSDFHLFLHLKEFLSSQCQHFQDDRGGDGCHTVVPIPGGRLLRHRIQKLVPWYDKCLNSWGEYVEK